MALDISPDRQRILDENGPVLVAGGPGSGKTTIALAKARLLVESGLAPGQSVLFLSFSRAAVARVIEASKEQLSKPLQRLLSIQTFHSFFWEILKGYGYLLGAPKVLRLLLPHEEAASRNLFDGLGGNWEEEHERLFLKEGLVAFDLFASKTQELLARSARLRALYSARHPMIVVDEAQDTAEDQWQCVRMLAAGTQLICLADLEQQIYDFRPGVSSERVTHIMKALNPLRVDLEGQNYRSPDCEIVDFGNDILRGTPRGAAYRGVSRLSFHADRARRDAAIRRSIGLALKRTRAATNENIENIALLATWGRGVNVISRALTGNGDEKSIPHRVMIDEASILQASTVIAFLLEPRRQTEAGEAEDLAEMLGLAVSFYRARGGKGNLAQAEKLAESAAAYRVGGKLRTNSVAAKLLLLMREFAQHPFSGDPRRDWLDARRMLRDTGVASLQCVAAEAEQLAAFQRGRRITSALTDLWQNQGDYRGARSALGDALAEDQLLSGADDLRGIHVMTIHKSKGKQFDIVIILDDPNSSPLLFCRETAPYPRCRRLLRVGITRARHHVLLLTDLYRPSELLDGHVL